MTGRISVITGILFLSQRTLYFARRYQQLHSATALFYLNKLCRYVHNLQPAPVLVFTHYKLSVLPRDRSFLNPCKQVVFKKMAGDTSPSALDIFSTAEELKLVETKSKLQLQRMKHTIEVLRIYNVEREVMGYEDLCSANQELKSNEEISTGLIFRLQELIHHHEDQLCLESRVSDIQKHLQSTTEQAVTLDTLLNIPRTNSNVFPDIERTVNSMVENQDQLLHIITDFSDSLKPKYEHNSSENVPVFGQECFENDDFNHLTRQELNPYKEENDSRTLVEASSSTTGNNGFQIFKESHFKFVYITLEELYGCKQKEECIMLDREYMVAYVDDFVPCHPMLYYVMKNRHRVRFQIDKSFRDGRQIQKIERIEIQDGILELIVTFSIRVEQHRFYNLVQDNLYVSIDISWKDALLGRCPGFRFLDNEVYKFAADQRGIIANDSIWEIPNKGMTEHGNLYIKFSVTACSKTSKEKKVDNEIARLLVWDFEQIPEDDEKVLATVMS